MPESTTASNQSKLPSLLFFPFLLRTRKSLSFKRFLDSFLCRDGLGEGQQLLLTLWTELLVELLDVDLKL